MDLIQQLAQMLWPRRIHKALLLRLKCLQVNVVNSLFNNNSIDILTIAKAGQYSENNYWNKSSGLLDQLACGYGGLIAIDFKDINNPIITKLESKQLEDKFDIVLVQTGNDHANLSFEYSSIPSEMISIANTQLQELSIKII